MGKKCNKCGEEKGLEYFSADKKNKDGLNGVCKGCVAIRNRQWREDNKEKIIQWRADNKECKKQYDVDNRKIISERRKVYREENKDKIAKQMKQYKIDNKQILFTKYKEYGINNKEKMVNHNKQYYINNKERISKQVKQWQKNNPEKKRIYEQRREAIKIGLPHTLTGDKWERIKQHFDNKCAYCGEDKPLTQEHFIPISKGGEYTHNNIIPVCQSCNSSKRNKDFFGWYPKHKYYSKKRERKILKYLGYENQLQQLSM